MKKFTLLAALILVLALVVCGPFSSSKSLYSGAIVSAEEVDAEDDMDEDSEEDEEDEEDEEEDEEAWKAEKERLADEIDALEEQLDDLEEQYEEALEDNLVDEAAALRDQMDALEAEIEAMEQAIEELEERNAEEEDEERQPWEIAKDALEAQKDEIEARKDALEDEIHSLEAQYEEAKASGDEAMAAQILADIAAKKAEKDALKAQMEAIKKEMHKAVLEMYTPEELNAIAAAAERLEAGYAGLKALPIENVLTIGVNIKFDTPPVIKEGRTLIPVRAISEALGATVEWDEIALKAKIKKNEKEIVLKLGSNKIYVNNVEGEIDVPAQTLSGRAVVPLRFVVENLGLKVEWDTATETIEIRAS